MPMNSFKDFLRICHYKKGKSIERHFDEELKQLNYDLLHMTALTEEAIYRSIEALKMQDKKIAQEVIDNDQKIDEMELKIEEKTIDLLALRQSMAIDLSFFYNRNENDLRLYLSLPLIKF